MAAYRRVYDHVTLPASRLPRDRDQVRTLRLYTSNKSRYFLLSALFTTFYLFSFCFKQFYLCFDHLVLLVVLVVTLTDYHN